MTSNERTERLCTALKFWRFSIRLLLTGLAVPLSLAACTQEIQPELRFDVLFLNGTVVDGTGAARFDADVGIRDGRIARVGQLSDYPATERYDISGLVLAPGFIDVHSHADEHAVQAAHRIVQGFVTQGVTTTVFGVDGEYGVDRIREHRRIFDRNGIGTNYMYYIGHNGVRTAVMDGAARAPTREELRRMAGMVETAMQEGAIGLSTGLMYLPGSHADSEEVIALARATAAYGGLYDSHIRDPADNLLASIDEALHIAREAGVAAHPAHLKAVGGNNFGKAGEIIALIEAARNNGQDVTADVYPYDGAAARPLVTVLTPPSDWPLAKQIGQLAYPVQTQEEQRQLIEGITNTWRTVLSDSDLRESVRRATEEPPAEVFSWIKVVGYSSLRLVVSETAEYEGRMITELAAARELDPFDLLAELIIHEGATAKVTLGAIQQADVRALIRQPWVMISSDGREGGFAGGVGHPRYRGSFPRVLGRYVREWGVLTLEDAIRKMTSLPASYLQLRNRGVIREDAVADIAVFEPDTIIDRATWANPEQYSYGVVHVLVNGRFALRNREMTGGTYGKYLPFRGPARAE